MTNPNSHVKFKSTKKHKKILTGISWKMCLRGEGMNNYWNHEPEFFWYKKKVRKSQEFFDSEVRPPPSSRFFEKIPDVIFLRPLIKNMRITTMVVKRMFERYMCCINFSKLYHEEFL